MLSLQDLLDHTTARILMIDSVYKNGLKQLILYSKWGCDGSSGQSEYKQRLPEESELVSDSHLFVTSVVPIRLIDETTGFVVWQNPVPSSVRFCRPILIEFTKETPEKTKAVVNDIQTQINALSPSLIVKEGNGVQVKHELFLTMIDGKVAQNLRYLCELEYIHPEDEGRRFVMAYNLGDGAVKISEIPRRNSGIREGVFLSSRKLELPDSDHNFPSYYTPDKFYIGAIIPVFKHRFRIIGCDLFVYNYMSANPDKFPQEVIDNVRNYHMREGNLKTELKAAVREVSEAAIRAELAAIGKQAIVEPSDMEKCLTALNVVEGSATPPRPPTPPMTTDIISYDDSLRAARHSDSTYLAYSRQSPCDEITPLKGILKSGGARDDHQKVVCFSGPVVDKEHEEKEKHPYYPPGKQPHFNEEEDFCARYRDPDAKERAERRAREECAYDIVPPPEAAGVSSMIDNEQEKPKLPGYLGTFNVDCKEVPEYMRLAPDAYDKIKHMRRDVPEISPAATRVAQHPRLPPADVDTCVHPPLEETGPCAPRKEEDVAFSCAHVEPKLPCCVPNTGSGETTNL